MAYLSAVLQPKAPDFLIMLQAKIPKLQVKTGFPREQNKLNWELPVQQEQQDLFQIHWSSHKQQVAVLLQISSLDEQLSLHDHYSADKIMFP